MRAHPQRSRWSATRVATAAAALLLGVAGTASAQPRTAVDRARADAVRLTQRLAAVHAVSPELVEARRVFGHAWGAYYRARTDALADLRRQPDFLAVRREIWDRQREVEAYHAKLPPDRPRIYAEARELLDLRASLTNRERAALENDPAVEAAREEMMAAFAAYLAAAEAAADRVKSDPSVVAAAQRVKAARGNLAP